MLPGLAIALSGCHLPWIRREAAVTSPILFATPPTKEEIIGAVNANGSRIQQLESDAKIRYHGIPLAGNLALERPRRFRLRAGISVLPGTGVDLGSNDELAWFFFEQSQPPGVYHVRHDQFEQSAARQFLPVNPLWLSEALGVVEFDRSGRHDGPYQQVPGKVEIHTHLGQAPGDRTKVTVVHEQYGWVLEQRIYERGQLMASAIASKHRYYPEQGVTLPQHVEIQIAPDQPTKLAFTVDLGNPRINSLVGNPQQLWSMPRPDGFPLIDLADPRQLPQLTSRPVFSSVPSYDSGSERPPIATQRPARAAFRPRYRRAIR